VTLVTPAVIGAIIATILAFLGWITAFFNFQKAKLVNLEKEEQQKTLTKTNKTLEKYKNRIDDPVIKNRIPLARTKGVSVLFLGTGGVGKTAIIKALTGMNEANPAIQTEHLATYTLVKETEYKVTLSKDKKKTPKRSLTRIYLEDTIGQNLNIGLKESRTREKRAKLIENTVVVIVVDLFPMTMKGTSYKSPNKKRVNSNINLLDKTFMQAIRDAVPKASSVVLFINKIDQLGVISKESNELAKTLYSDLTDCIRKYLVSNDTAFIKKENLITIVGSAARGWGVCGDSKISGIMSLSEIIMNDATVIN